LPQAAIAHGGGSHNERTISNSFGDRFEFLRVLQNMRCTHRRAGFAKREFEWIYQPEMATAKISHGASGSANVERIARAHEDDDQVVEMGDRQAINSSGISRLRCRRSLLQVGFRSNF
jgi:hypothetical protein